MVSNAVPRIPVGAWPARRSAPVSARLRRAAAIGLARITGRLVGAAGHQGTALPGMVAERVWPEALVTLGGQLRTTILVVGTNGKTTTSGLIAEILCRTGGEPIANRSGANMRQGIVTTLVRASDFHGRLRRGDEASRDAVLEVDEVALGQILPELGLSVIVATNLFRDQLDRYGEADAIVDIWAVALAAAAKGSILVHCADDPRLAMLASRIDMPTITFGLVAMPTDRDQGWPADDAVADPVACRTCGRQLVYEWRSIGHLGAFACPDGHVRRAEPDIAIEMLKGDAGDAAGPSTSVAITLRGRQRATIARPALTGLINAYNVGAAAAPGLAIGHDVARSADAIDGYGGPFGRFEWIEIDGRHIVLVLIKNTVSLAETVRLGASLEAGVVLIGLNDAAADGRDVSWIWDAPIAALVAGRAVVLTGSRATDLHLRIKYDHEDSMAAPRSIQEAGSLAAALDLAVAEAPRGGVVVAAATYSAMMGLRRIAQRRGDASPAPH
jgi:lipid II isoglutaminyl synthase (glutamine-hydrolysing)